MDISLTYALAADSFVEWWWNRLGLILNDTWPLESLNAAHRLKPLSLNSSPPITSCPCSDTLSSVSFSVILAWICIFLRHIRICLLSVVTVLVAQKYPPLCFFLCLNTMSRPRLRRIVSKLDSSVSQIIMRCYSNLLC